MYDSEGEDDDALLFPTSTTTPSRPVPSPSRPTVGTVGTSRPVSQALSDRDPKKPRRSAGGEDGYNSDDEGRQGAVADSHGTLPEDEGAFEEDLRRVGYHIKRMTGDGNCLFRAVADQVYGDAEMHDEVRSRCMDYMEKEREHYSQFVAEDFTEYVRRKKRDKVFGNHLEIQAISEIYNRPIEVYAYGHREPINIFHKHYFTEYAPIRLSYHWGNHYNSVIDPENPSVGVGLGLPQLNNPGLEMERAIEQSIEDTLYKDVVEASEWEATQKQLEEEVLRQSALEANVAVPGIDREGDFFMGEGELKAALGGASLDPSAGSGLAAFGDEDEQLAAILRQSELEYWQSLSRE